MGQICLLSPPQTTLEHGGLWAVWCPSDAPTPGCREPPLSPPGRRVAGKEHRETARELLTAGPHEGGGSVDERAVVTQAEPARPFYNPRRKQPAPQMPPSPPPLPPRAASGQSLRFFSFFYFFKKLISDVICPFLGYIIAFGLSGFKTH